MRRKGLITGITVNDSNPVIDRLQWDDKIKKKRKKPKGLTARRTPGAKDLSDDCVFEEHIEENNYNTYSRIRAGKKTFLALDNRGKARRTQIPVSRPLGNLSGYALTLTKRWEGPKHSQCPPRRHRGKLKRPPPFHRNCQRRVAKQNMRKRKHKKANDPKKKRHPKARRKHDSTTSTTEMSWDESTMSTMSTTDEFFRSATGRA
ncbi:unnamed protein product [Pieris macdunnoughi]|uniref:Uncharacterized protein n=1 Tax=Pieris macdunnoughi TaxID=345717 RepID=A0A821W5R1_9NEOP|nr:unnamed protein product [Pieris macdunnoughi]